MDDELDDNMEVTPELIDKVMRDPEFMARHQATVMAVEHALVTLLGTAFAACHAAQHGDREQTVEASNKLAEDLEILNEGQLRVVLGLALSQLVEQIAARVAPDGNLDDLHNKITAGEPALLGQMSGWKLSAPKEE